MSKPFMALTALAALLASGCQQAQTSTPTSETTMQTQSAPTPVPTPAGAVTTVPGDPVGEAKLHKLASGLQYVDLKLGDGTMAEPGMNVSVQYTCWLAEGLKVDSSLDRGQPLAFQLGSGQMVAGFDEGVKGMRIGGKRKLTVPPALGWGAAGAGGVIPPNATVVFDVELLSVK